MIAVLSVTLLAGAVSLGVFLNEGSAGAADAKETDSESTKRGYEFIVYTLNCSGESSTGTGTLITFDEHELPFDFSEIRFGDFRMDTQYVDSYYGGLCLVISAYGPCGNLTFKEGNGKNIQEIRYEGQPLIVLNGWEYVSRDSDGKIIDRIWGSMQTPAYDWRDGTWVPSDGILVESLDDMTLSNASLCLMVFEPSNTTSIPEFNLVLGCMACAILVVLVRRARSRSTEATLPGSN